MFPGFGDWEGLFLLLKHTKHVSSFACVVPCLTQEPSEFSKKNPAYYTLQACFRFQGLVNPMGNPGAPASIFGYPKNGEKCWRMWKELFRLSEDEHLGPAAEETLGFLYQQHEVLNPQAFLCRAWGLDSDVGLLGFFSS